jgi:hypothetical protein
LDIPQFRLKQPRYGAEKLHVAHEPVSPHHRARPASAPGHASHDAFVVIGLVAVIAGAAIGSLAVALLVFLAPALALGGAIYLRDHL